MALVAKSSLTITAGRDPKKYILDVDADLTALFIAMRAMPSVTKGIVAPTSTPRQVGDIYVDTVLAKAYISSGIASSADWRILN